MASKAPSNTAPKALEHPVSANSSSYDMAEVDKPLKEDSKESKVHGVVGVLLTMGGPALRSYKNPVSQLTLMGVIILTNAAIMVGLTTYYLVRLNIYVPK